MAEFTFPWDAAPGGAEPPPASPSIVDMQTVLDIVQPTVDRARRLGLSDLELYNLTGKCIAILGIVPTEGDRVQNAIRIRDCVNVELNKRDRSQIGTMNILLWGGLGIGTLLWFTRR